MNRFNKAHGIENFLAERGGERQRDEKTLALGLIKRDQRAFQTAYAVMKELYKVIDKSFVFSAVYPAPRAAKPGVYPRAEWPEVKGVRVVSRLRKRRLEFGLSENYSGRGVRRDALLTSAGKSGRVSLRKRVRRDALLTSARKSGRLACKKWVRRDALLTSAGIALRAVKPKLYRYEHLFSVVSRSSSAFRIPHFAFRNSRTPGSIRNEMQLLQLVLAW